jgi:hypothetical protein
VLCILAHRAIGKAPERLAGTRCAKTGAGLAGLTIGLLFLVPATPRVREPGARTVSISILRQIGFAMYAYAEDHNGQLPPSASRDRDGRPLLSWRVQLLPYFDQEKLYNEFHLDEPWDSPHNLTLLPRMPHLYETPAADKPLGWTCYQVFTGPDTPFENVAGPRLPEDFVGRTSGTILVIESEGAVPWTKPQDIEYDPAKPLPKFGGLYTGPGRFRVLPSSRRASSRRAGVNILLADGSARFVEKSMPEHAWRWVISRTTQEPKPQEW